MRAWSGVGAGHGVADGRGTGTADGRPADSFSWLAVAGVVALAWGILLALTGAATGRSEAAAWIGAAVALGLVLLLAGGWRHARPLALLALTLPLPAFYGSETLRVAPPLILTAVLLAAWGLRHAPFPGRLDPGPFPLRTAAWWLGAAAFSALFAASLLPAVREVTSLALLLGLGAVATRELTVRPERRRLLALVLAWIAGLSGVAATLQAAGLLPTPFTLAGTGLGRATLGFEWPNEAGMFLALLLPFSAHAVSAARGPGRRALAAAGAVAALAGLVATFSRGSWLAAAAAPAVLLLVGGWRPAARAWVAAALALLLVEVASGGAVSSRVAMTARDPLVGQRAGLMLTGLIMFADNPLTGLGPGGFAEHLGLYGTQVTSLWDYVGSAHNTYIQTAAETGVPGLLALLAFGVVVFRVLLSAARREAATGSRPGLDATVLWAFATLGLVSMVEWSLTQGVGQLGMLIVALGLSGAAAHDRGPGADGPGAGGGQPPRSAPAGAGGRAP